MLVCIYNGKRVFFFLNERETMETDKYLTLTSATNNSSNFNVTLVDYLTLGDDWEVALV